MKTKLIAIEGVDASGKRTQAEMLVKNLSNHGVNRSKPCRSTLVSFPIYDSPSGQIIEKYLGGEFGEPSNVDPKLASSLYALNRREFGNDLYKLLYNHHVVCDRYVASNMAHQGGKIKSASQRAEFIRWCADLEYDNFNLPHPDITIFLHMPWYISKSMIHARGRALDLHETDDLHLQNAENTYLELADMFKWATIECFVGGVIRTPDDIADEVYNLVVKQYTTDH